MNGRSSFITHIIVLKCVRKFERYEIDGIMLNLWFVNVLVNTMFSATLPRYR